jgi:citrate lyase subunit beta/citryl-CoA lyase
VQARADVLKELELGGFGRKVVAVRVNSLASAIGVSDVEAVRTFFLKTGVLPHAVVLPKVENADTVQQCVDLLGDAQAVRIWAMIETPLGVLNADRIAGAHARMQCLVAGTADLTKDLHAQHTPDRTPMLYSLSRIVLAARAFGLVALDGVHLDLSDDEGFGKSCAQGRAMGFDGKTLIHPRTIGAANEAFSPSEAELVSAQRVIEAHRAAMARGSGVVLLDGRLIESLHVQDALRIQAIAAHIASEPVSA